MDEIKRALETAELIPFRYLITHLGVPGEKYDLRKFDAALTSLEHLRLFAGQRDVQLLLENIPNELSTPRRLLEFIRHTHLDALKLCFDSGHAHLDGDVKEAFHLLKDRIASTHLHDNNGETDEHRFPFEGGIAWEPLIGDLQSSAGEVPLLLEARSTARSIEEIPASLDKAAEVCKRFEANPGGGRTMTEGNGAATPEEGKGLPPVVSIENISRLEGKEVTVQGWLYNLRQSGKLLFPIFRDGTGLLQGIVAKKAVAPEVFALTRELTQESSLIVRGTVRADSRAVGGYELDVTQLELVQGVPVEEPFPITPKEHGVEFLMNHRHLWLRSQRQHAILRIRHEISKACRDYLDGEGFILVDTPILTPGGLRRHHDAF